MADSSESESEEKRPQKPLENFSERQRNTEKDLQTIFKKLRVDNDTRRRFKTKSRHAVITRRGSYLNRKEIKKKIIKDATFVYKSYSPQKESKLSDSNSELLDLGPLNQHHHKDRLYSSNTTTKTPSTKHVNQSNKSPKDISKSCSGQFRQAQSSKIPHGNVNFDDTTPEELAAYFEQLLHIPKPMSAMAEMMYT